MINSGKIKARLLEVGVSQGTAAQTIGLSQSTLSQKINGARPLSLDEAEKLANIMQIDIGEFGKYFFA